MSTVGFIAGIAVANVSRSAILLTGTVLVLVEAFSMAAGSFLAESSVEGYLTKTDQQTRTPLLGGIVMFFSYFLSGFIPLFPYVVMQAAPAFWTSIILSVGSLFFLGAVGARMSRIGIWRSAFRMAVVGGIAIGLGVGVGILLPQWLSS